MLWGRSSYQRPMAANGSVVQKAISERASVTNTDTEAVHRVFLAHVDFNTGRHLTWRI